MGQLGDPQVTRVRSGDEHLAERAGIDEAQLAATLPAEDHVGVGCQRRTRVVSPAELSTHAQVDDQRVTAVQVTNQVLSPPADPHQAPALDPLDQLAGQAVPTQTVHTGGGDPVDRQTRQGPL